MRQLHCHLKDIVISKRDGKLFLHQTPVIARNTCLNINYSAFQIDELHRHNQNLVGTLHKGVPTVVYRHENCRKMTIVTAREVKIFEMSNKRNKP